MNSAAEISRLPGPAATSPASHAWITACQAATGAGCPGSGASAANVSRCARRVTPGGWRPARSQAAPPPSRPWQRRRRRRPGRPPSAPARHTAGPVRAEPVHSAAAGVQRHAGKLRPAGHDQAGIGNTARCQRPS
jgi:hypothetical protein